MVRHQQILLIDDEPAIGRLVRATLQADGYAVVTASCGEEALPLLDEEPPDLVILDLMMPGMDGFETLRRIRTRSKLPVIMLTARATDADTLRGLQGGADDYITKPFNPDELAARVKAVLRRSAGGLPAGGRTTLRYSGVEIDLDRRRVMVGAAEARLSHTEWALLEQLAANAGRVMLHGELLSRIWGPEFRDESSYLRTWVSRLRAKLKPSVAGQSLITTFPGVGYRLEPPSD
jgi:two-component system, OmpR family, KDP operon response regulator KdpE